MEPIVYHVRRIDGDYAVLTDVDGEDNPVAMALLPIDIQEGDRIIWETGLIELRSKFRCN